VGNDTQVGIHPGLAGLADQCIPKLSVSERGVYAASLTLLPQLSLISSLVGSFTLKRPEGRAPTNRQLLDAPLATAAAQFLSLRLSKHQPPFANKGWFRAS